MRSLRIGFSYGSQVAELFGVQREMDRAAQFWGRYTTIGEQPTLNFTRSCWKTIDTCWLAVHGATMLLRWLVEGDIRRVRLRWRMRGIPQLEQTTPTL